MNGFPADLRLGAIQGMIIDRHKLLFAIHARHSRSAEFSKGKGQAQKGQLQERHSQALAEVYPAPSLGLA